MEDFRYVSIVKYEHLYTELIYKFNDMKNKHNFKMMKNKLYTRESNEWIDNKQIRLQDTQLK